MRPFNGYQEFIEYIKTHPDMRITQDGISFRTILWSYADNGCEITHPAGYVHISFKSLFDNYKWLADGSKIGMKE